MPEYQQIQQSKKPELPSQRRTTLANLTRESNSAAIIQRARIIRNHLPWMKFYSSSAASETGQLPGQNVLARRFDWIGSSFMTVNKAKQTGMSKR